MKPIAHLKICGLVLCAFAVSLGLAVNSKGKDAAVGDIIIADFEGPGWEEASRAGGRATPRDCSVIAEIVARTYHGST